MIEGGSFFGTVGIMLDLNGDRKIHPDRRIMKKLSSDPPNLGGSQEIFAYPATLEG